jgi:hypothetical protein
MEFENLPMGLMLYPTLLLYGGVTMVVGLGVYQRLSTAAEGEVRSRTAPHPVPEARIV